MRVEKVILFTKSSAHTEFLCRLISLSIWDYRQNIVFWDLLVICDHTALAKVNESNIFSIFRDFILLSEPRALNLDQPVDKKEAFLPVFVYCPSRFKAGYGQNSDFWNLSVKSRDFRLDIIKRLQISDCCWRHWIFNFDQVFAREELDFTARDKFFIKKQNHHPPKKIRDRLGSFLSGIFLKQ